VRWTNFVVPLISSPELTDQSDQDQLADLGKFGIDDRHQSSKDGSERQGGCLSAHDGPGE